MNTIREENLRSVDYLGVLGKDPKSDPETAKVWRELRDMVVHGPRLEFTFATKPRLWPWQWGSVTSKRWSCGPRLHANLPKGGGKTEVMLRMFETGEKMGMHGYMNYPGLWNDLEKPEGFPVREHQRESLAEMAKRFTDNIPEYKGHRKTNIPILTGFGSLNTMLSGGLRRGDWLQGMGGHVSPEIRAKTCRNWPIQAMNSERLMEAYAKAMEGQVYIDLEGDWDIEATMKRLRGHIDGVVVNPNFRGGKRMPPVFQFKDGFSQYLYNPTDRLTQLYEKARKKYKHKDAVNYLVKREKHGRKLVAKQLEEIGAAYANKERDELRAKTKKAADEKWEKQYADLYDIPQFSPGDYKQFAGRIDRTPPKESEE